MTIDAYREAHRFADTDLNPNAIHHTLGSLPGQAASGQHTHNDLLPVGSLIMWGGPENTIPDKFVLCNGSIVSRTEYADLFSIIGELYGAGDGSTTFQLPNFTFKFPRGGNTGFDPGGTGGDAYVTLTEANMPPHTHGGGDLTAQSNGSHDHLFHFRDGTGVQLSGAPRGNGTNDTTNRQPINPDGAHTHNVTGATGTGSGSSTPVPITPPYLDVKFIIKAR